MDRVYLSQLRRMVAWLPPFQGSGPILEWLELGFMTYARVCTVHPSLKSAVDVLCISFTAGLQTQPLVPLLITLTNNL